MELKLEIFEAFCSTSEFKINGVAADSNDFGGQYDHDQEHAEDYACGDMRFERKASTAEVLDKYKITESEYQEIAEKLEDGLSFGCCGWCA